MNCPNCDVDLVMSGHDGVEMDYCPKCRGVWLDREELDRIVKRSLQSAPVAAQAQPQDSPQPQLSRHHSHHPYKGNESLQGELFG